MTNTHSKSRRLLAAITTAVALTALAGCTSAGNGNPQESGDDRLSIIHLSQAAESDASYSINLNGMKAAAEDLDVDLTIRSLPEGQIGEAAPYSRLLDQAAAEGADGFVFTDAHPEALNEQIRAIAEDTPVMLTAAGAGQVDATGAIGIVAPDEYALGELSAQRMVDAGVEHPLLITIVPGIPLVDDRNNGFLSVYDVADVNVLALPTDILGTPTSITNAIEAALVGDTSIDGVFSVGVLFNPSMLSVREGLGDRAEDVMWASIDIGEQARNALEAGELAFAADQQAYLQGYLTLQSLVFNIRYGFTPALRELLVEPGFVTPDNYADYAVNVDSGVRG